MKDKQYVNKEREIKDAELKLASSLNQMEERCGQLSTRQNELNELIEHY